MKPGLLIRYSVRLSQSEIHCRIVDRAGSLLGPRSDGALWRDIQERTESRVSRSAWRHIQRTILARLGPDTWPEGGVG